MKLIILMLYEKFDKLKALLSTHDYCIILDGTEQRGGVGTLVTPEFGNLDAAIVVTGLLDWSSGGLRN